MPVPCRDAGCVRAMKGWRAEKRKSYGTASVAGDGWRLSARHMRSFDALPRFALLERRTRAPLT
jgi:hypothetical protein